MKKLMPKEKGCINGGMMKRSDKNAFNKSFLWIMADEYIELKFSSHL